MVTVGESSVVRSEPECESSAESGAASNPDEVGRDGATGVGTGAEADAGETVDRMRGGSGVTAGAAGLTGAGAGGTAGHSPVLGRAEPFVNGTDPIGGGWNSTGTPPMEVGSGCATMIEVPCCPGKCLEVRESSVAGRSSNVPETEVAKTRSDDVSKRE
jgi:hypothetical protein